jgi:hypothetical protein
MGLEICENCVRVIGNLEQAHVYNNKIVCKECKALLDNKISDITPEEDRKVSKKYNRVNGDHAVQIIRETSPRVQTIQRTFKIYKAGMLIGTIMFIGGIIKLNVVFIFMGILISIISRIGAWWENG